VRELNLKAKQTRTWWMSCSFVFLLLTWMVMKCNVSTHSSEKKKNTKRTTENTTFFVSFIRLVSCFLHLFSPLQTSRIKGTKRSGECVLFVSLCSYWLICNGMRVKHEISQVNKEETKHTQFLVLFLFPLWLCSFRASLAFHYKWTKPKGKKNEEPEKTWNVV